MSAKKRLSTYLDEKGISRADFSRDTGLSNGYLNSGNSIGSDKIEIIISTYPDLNLRWLITGEGDMLKNVNPIVNPIVNPNRSAKRSYVPITNSRLQAAEHIDTYGESNVKGGNTIMADVQASAGFGSYLDNPSMLNELPTRDFPNAPPGLNVAFQITGDSMHNTVRHLDYVVGNQIVDRSDIREGYVYIIIDREDGALCKRIYFETEKSIRIVSDNMLYKPYIRYYTDIVAIFKAFGRWSSDFRNYHDDVRKSILDLQLRIDDIDRELKQIKS